MTAEHRSASTQEIVQFISETYNKTMCLELKHDPNVSRWWEAWC